MIDTDCKGSCNPTTMRLQPQWPPETCENLAWFSLISLYGRIYVCDKDSYYIFYRQEATLNKSVGEGKIFYQPDEVDDFDEEDPDDDLDI